jgi:Leucine-rich repeat (LRR) protein
MAKYTDIEKALANPLDVTHLEIRCKYGSEIPIEVLHCQNLHTLEIKGYNYVVPEAFKDLAKLEKVIFSGRYSQFPSFVFELPRLKHLHFDGYGMDYFPDDFDKLPHLESLKIVANLFNNPYQDFPRSVFSLHQLKALHVYANLERLAEQPDCLPNLEYLYLHYAHSSLKVMQAICRLHKLHTLLLHSYYYNSQPLQLPADIGNLKLLKHLQLDNNYIQDLPQELRHLNQLENLNLTNGKFTSLPFVAGDLPALKSLTLEQNRQLNIPQELQKFAQSSIHHLNIKSCGLKVFPEEILSFKKLQHLNISNNRIDKLPLDIVNLPELSNIETTKTTLAKTTEVKSGKPINKLLRLSKENKASEDFKKIGLALLVNDTAYLAKVPSCELLPALNMPQSVIRENALVALEQHFGDETNSMKHLDAVVTIIGKNKGLPINKTYQQLQDLGIQTSRTLQHSTTHVVLGTEPGKKLAQVQDRESTPIWVLPKHLRDFLQEHTSPYLMQDSQANDTLDSLGDLLQNDDPQNVTLGLTMMMEGGIPDELLYDIVLISLKKNYEPSKLAKKVLARYTNEEFQAVLRKHSRKAMVNILRAFEEEPLIDQSRLAISALKFFKNEPNRHYYFNRLQRVAFELCFKQGGEVAKLAIDARTEDQALELTGFYIKQIPEELRSFKKMKTMHLGGNGLKVLPNWFTEFTQLERLELTNNMFNKAEKARIVDLLPKVKVVF